MHVIHTETHGRFQVDVRELRVYLIDDDSYADMVKVTPYVYVFVGPRDGVLYQVVQVGDRVMLGLVRADMIGNA